MCCVKLPCVSTEFITSIVYGSNCSIKRRLLWSELEYIACVSLTFSSPWIILGDFNEVVCMSKALVNYVSLAK